MFRRSFAVCCLVLAAATPRAQAQTLNQDHGRYDAADVDKGRRLYGTQCRACHGVAGDNVQGIDLRLGRFRTTASASDEALAGVITSGVPGKGMPGFRFQPGDMTSIVAFIRSGFDEASLSTKVGDAARGRSLFDGRAECATCHRVNGRGPRLAPDLSSIGATRTLASLQRSILQPTASLLPINRPVRIVTKDGRTLKGRRLNEDTYTVQIADDQGRLHSLTKADLKQFVVETTASMPSYETRLAPDEVADVIAYLVSLKGL
jgi:putative heme-binding domain-containing protein